MVRKPAAEFFATFWLLWVAPLVGTTLGVASLRYLLTDNAAGE